MYPAQDQAWWWENTSYMFWRVHTFFFTWMVKARKLNAFACTMSYNAFSILISKRFCVGIWMMCQNFEERILWYLFYIIRKYFLSIKLYVFWACNIGVTCKLSENCNSERCKLRISIYLIHHIYQSMLIGLSII